MVHSTSLRFLRHRSAGLASMTAWWRQEGEGQWLDLYPYQQTVKHKLWCFILNWWASSTSPQKCKFDLGEWPKKLSIQSLIEAQSPTEARVKGALKKIEAQLLVEKILHMQQLQIQNKVAGPCPSFPSIMWHNLINPSSSGCEICIVCGHDQSIIENNINTSKARGDGGKVCKQRQIVCYYL